MAIKAWVDVPVQNRFRRTLGGASAVLLGAGLLAGLSLAPASADTVPPAGVPATVSADVLPTVQINGVVWSSVTVGNIVYATGEFTSARPAGSPAGTNETPRGGLLAFDITTGNLITSFNHTLNAAGRIIVASPDGSRVYVGGDFTTVDGQSHGHIVAIDTASGNLATGFAATVDQTVLGLTATNSTVYAGGSFTTANATARNRVAAFSATTGAVTSWAPTADNGTVTAMVLSPDQSRVVIAGRFTTLNGASRYGIGAVDSSSGALTAWNSSFPIRDAGDNSSITSLTADANQIYATGYVFGSGGNFEGTAGFDATGTLNWLDSCHGDHYSAYATNGVLYSASHAHDCSDVGGWEDTNPRTWHRGMANSSSVTPGCTLAHNNNANYADFFGQPCAQLLDWYPDFAAGTYTGAAQGPWSVSGNSNYIVMGGEFPTVNKVAQNGLVRFAVKSIAPNKVAPIANASLIPVVTSTRPNTATASWTGTWDRDNEYLTYLVFRDGGTTPIASLTKPSTFWNLPAMSFTDTGVVGGTSHTYRLNVVDPTGNVITIGKSAAVVVMSGDSPADNYGKAVYADLPDVFYRVNETSGSVATDSSGAGSTGTYFNGVTKGVASPVATGTAVAFDGSAGTLSTNTSVTAPATFSEELWFNTTTTQGGKLIGFQNSQSGNSGTYDRHVYMLNTGQLVFGTQTAATVAARSLITSPAAYNDGKWHHVVATQSATGMKLYVDSQPVASNTQATAQSYTGFWRIGGGSSWAGPSGYFAGTIDEAAVYSYELTPAQIATHFGSSNAGNRPPVGSFTTSVSNLAVSFNAGASIDPDGTIASYAWNFGDGVTATGVAVSHTYAVAGAYQVTLTLTDNKGGVGTLIKTVTTNLPPVAAFAVTGSFTTRTFDATASTDPDGTIASYAWNFGDGATASGVTATHTYAVTGTYSVTLTLTDDVGAVSTLTKSVSAAPNQAPIAAFSAAMNLQTLSVDASTSTDPEAGPLTYAWNFGDGTSATGVTATHTYAGTGSFTVTLTVTDNGGLTATTSRQVASNLAPTAAFTAAVTGLSVSVNGASSSDPDGTIASYAWNFGDGSTGTGMTATHSYAVGGTYTVTLSVTDNGGATAGTTRSVVINRAPVAAFTSTVTQLSVAFNAAGSSDADGTIAGYAWNFGDGTTGTGVAPTHVYAGAGTYPVTLTVTDNAGATGALSSPVTLTSAIALASDDFGRVVANGWGTADLGGAWTRSTSSASTSVANGVGVATLSPPRFGTASATSYLNSVSSNDTDIAVAFSVNRLSTQAVNVSVIGRRVAGSGDYRAKVSLVSNGTVRIAFVRTNSVGNEVAAGSTVTVAGLSYTAGDTLLLRMQATGTSPVTLKARVWKANTAEPTTWAVTSTSTASGLNQAGSVGVSTNASNSGNNSATVVTFDQVRVYRASTLG
jgi:PKD repeat protein